MLAAVKTPITINYDGDILVDPEAVVEAVHEIENNNYDLIYPFSLGWGQRQIVPEERAILFERMNSLGWEDITEWLSSKCIHTANLAAAWAIIEGTDTSEEEKALQQLLLPKIDPLNMPSTFGQAQIFNTESYKSGGGENQNFISWGPEDKERYYRFKKLGYKVKHLSNYVIYHLNHSRGPDSSAKNPHHLRGLEEYLEIMKFNKKEMTDYALNIRKLWS